MRKSVAVLVALAAAVLAPAALAGNPSFETGDFTDWSVNAPSGSAEVLPGGAPGGGNYFGAVGAGDEDEYQTISTTVSLQAGDAVTAAALFYDAEGAGEKCFFDDQGDVLVMLGGNVVGTILTGSSCASEVTGASGWGGNTVYVSQDGVYTVIARVKNVGDSNVPSQVWLDALAKRTPRAGYCAAAGNTARDGTALVAGSFLELRPGQPATDAHYTSATLAHFVEGKGLTCDPVPAGYVQDGLAGDAQHVPNGLYAYYKAP